MPKVEIDYSNTIFYKIFCKDTTIKDLYVGLTTNFVQRKHAHKQSCKNEKALNHNCKLYNAIRNAGGWDNWQMEIIAFHNCADSYEARKKEQEYFEAVGATLNSIDPFPKPKIKEPSLKIVKDKKILFCEPCNVHFAHWKTQETHNHTKKHHKMVAMHIPNELEQDNIHKNTTSNSSIIPSKFVCDKCHYSTSRNSQYERHILTDKHLRISQATLSNAEATPKMTKCENCNKVYRDRTGLWRHKKNCIPGTNNHAYSDNPATIETIANTSNKDELINCLMKEIQEFKQLILEIVKKGHI